MKSVQKSIRVWEDSQFCTVKKGRRGDHELKLRPSGCDSSRDSTTSMQLSTTRGGVHRRRASCTSDTAAAHLSVDPAKHEYHETIQFINGSRGTLLRFAVAAYCAIHKS